MRTGMFKLPTHLLQIAAFFLVATLLSSLAFEFDLLPAWGSLLILWEAVVSVVFLMLYLRKDTVIEH